MASSKTGFGGILKGDFTQYRKKLSGSISYSLPETPYEDFKAYTTLRNDPKIEEATYENLIVKGSLLKSGWMIGLVLYVGSDSKGGGSQDSNSTLALPELNPWYHLPIRCVCDPRENSPRSEHPH
jgi:hypothetical protein